MNATMKWLFGMIFRPPTMPPIRLPLPARLVPGARVAIDKAFELAYYRGVIDGLLAGLAVAALVVEMGRLFHATRRRPRPNPLGPLGGDGRRDAGNGAGAAPRA